jgi:hypothetical protein
MTGTGTFLQFNNRILYFRILNLLMRTGFIVSGVASQTGTHHTIVVEVGRDPGIRRMTFVTLRIGLDVVLIFAGRDRTVVTISAGSRLDSTMIKHGGFPRIRRVAIITLSIGLDVVLVLTGCDRAVMAARTSTEDLRVIDPHDGRPAKIIVTILADIGRVDVGKILTGGFDAVMAAETIIDDAAVIKECGNPAC